MGYGKWWISFMENSISQTPKESLKVGNIVWEWAKFWGRLVPCVWRCLTRAWELEKTLVDLFTLLFDRQLWECDSSNLRGLCCLYTSFPLYTLAFAVLSRKDWLKKLFSFLNCPIKWYHITGYKGLFTPNMIVFITILIHRTRHGSPHNLCSMMF